MTERSAPSEWEERPSILAQLRAWSAKHSLRPTDGSPPALCDPDEIPIAWAQHPDRQHRPPSFSSRDRATAEELAAAEAIVTAMKAVTAAEDDVGPVGAWTTLYRAALSFRRRSFRLVLDGMIARRVRASSVRPIVRWLLDRAVHGEVIDLAIFLVGAVRYHDAIDDLYALGRHQAFWGLTAWVLDRFGEDTVDLRWARAASAGGIERRRILERIAPRLSDRSDVRDWVLRRGRSFDDVRSQAGADLTAVCAVAGDLADVLAPIDVGDDLLDIACSYLARLLRNHPTDGIEAYPDGILAVDRLIGHLLDRCDTITRLGCVYTLLVWLEEPSVVAASVRLRRTSSRLPAEELASRWERRESLGWTVEIRDALADDGLRILRRPAASNLVRTTFAQHETAGYADLDLAWQIAPTVVIDLWPEAFRLLQGSPFNWTLFRWLLETDDAARAEQVIQFAARLVPPRAPGDTTMFTSAPRHALGFTAVIDLMDAMHRHGIYNERLVAYGLYADDTVVRDWPAGVLEKRPLDLWGDEVIVALRTTPASCGCFEPTRQRLLAMLPEGLT